MRTLAKNKQELYYALYKGEEEEYELDENGNKILDYVDEDGSEYYRVTGVKIPTYFDPVSFYGNISMSGGEASTQEYGIDVTAYDALLVLDKDEIPIDETSILMFYKQNFAKKLELYPSYDLFPEKNIYPGYIYEKTKEMYKVLAIKPSLNQLKVLLGRVVC